MSEVLGDAGGGVGEGRGERNGGDIEEIAPRTADCGE